MVNVAVGYGASFLFAPPRPEALTDLTILGKKDTRG